MAKLQRLAMAREAFPLRTFEEERIVNQPGTQEHDAEHEAPGHRAPSEFPPEVETFATMGVKLP